MKKFKTALFLAFVIITSNACTPTNEKTSTESVTMKTHVNQETGITLDVPENWIIEETPKDTAFGSRVFTASHPDENVGAQIEIETTKSLDGSTDKQLYSKEMLLKASENTVSEQTITTLAKNMEEEIKQKVDVSVSVQPTEIDLNGNPFYHTQYTFKYKDFIKQKTSYMDIYFGYANYEYIYMYTLSPDDTSHTMMSNIVTSIKFTSTIKMVPYTDNEMGISASIPETWTVDDSNSPTSVIFSDNSTGSTASIIVQDDAGTSDEDLKNKLEQNVTSTISGFEESLKASNATDIKITPSEIESVTISGHPFYRMKLNATANTVDGVQEVFIYMYMSIVNGKEYTFIANGVKQEEKVILDFLDSIKLP